MKRFEVVLTGLTTMIVVTVLTTQVTGATSHDTNQAPEMTVPASIGVTEDVASTLTGISFADADAGGAAVTATLSVPSGALAASSGGGVTVGGSSSALTLTGSIPNLNTFLADANVTFTTATNDTAEITLTVVIDDNGNTGTGGTKTDTDTVTLTVSAVNDAPVMTVPISINVNEDVGTALTGISFADVDAGSATVTATLSVASGSLAATSASGVTVTGSGTGTLTLSGSIADLNGFVATSALTFTTALNSTSNVVLTVGISDNGNTGAGGALNDTDTATLMVTAVNDAPVHTVPGAQTVLAVTDLVFSSADGNLVSVADVDAGGGTVRVTLTGSNGSLTLPATVGLTFAAGDGSDDATMTFEGTLADVNAALTGMVFAPTPSYVGAASVQITTSDLGLSGSGGPQTDSDTIPITVRAPGVTSVAATNPDGVYRLGDVITVTIGFDAAVTVNTGGGTPRLGLDLDLSLRFATYVFGSGTDTLGFRYTVQEGDQSPDLEAESTAALDLNGGTIRDAADNDAVLMLPALGGPDSISGQHDIGIDGVRPTATVVLDDATLTPGQTTTVTFTFAEPVTGFTAGNVTVSGGSISAPSSADGGTTWTATLTPSGSVVPSGSVDLDLWGVADAVGNSGLGTVSAAFTVGSAGGSPATDTAAPTASVVLAPTTIGAGTTSTVTFTFSEPVTDFDLGDVTAPHGTLTALATSDGGTTWTATFRPTTGALVADGVISLDLAGVVDLAGNPGTGTATSAAYSVDTEPPTLTITVADAVLGSGGATTVTFTFSEPVLGFGGEDVAVPNGTLGPITPISAAARQVLAAAAEGGAQVFTAVYTPAAGVSDADNVFVVDLSGVTDLAGNPGVATASSPPFAVETAEPTTPPGTPIQAALSDPTGPTEGTGAVELPQTGGDASVTMALLGLALLLTGRAMITVTRGRRSVP